jgi:lipopolysaccharide/colanic/teichoic acid biosynthesis glycosyltransferase
MTGVLETVRSVMASNRVSDGGDRMDPDDETARSFSFAPWASLPPLPKEPVRYPEVATEEAGILDRLAALLLLVVLSPLILILAVAIKIDSPGGPVFYGQERVGLDRRNEEHASAALPDGGERRSTRGAGKVFTIYKLRTMVPNAELLTGPVWAADDDPRITRLGKILRKLRLDELPQLINVVRGEMRLIGPRPERPHFVNRLCEEIPGYEHRQKVLPGITGLAQIERDYDASVDDVKTKVKYDLFYVKNRSVLLDLKILIRTIDVMIRGRGAR